MQVCSKENLLDDLKELEDEIPDRQTKANKRTHHQHTMHEIEIIHFSEANQMRAGHCVLARTTVFRAWIHERKGLSRGIAA